MLSVTIKRLAEGLCFVEKINKDIDGFYDDFLGSYLSHLQWWKLW